MAQQHFFVTGAMGCIGAWVVRNLVQENSSVTVFDLSADRHRLELIMTADELTRVTFIQGDLTQTNTVRDALTDSEATHIIHLGALQVPFCKADPPVGAAVNVLGTVNMFEAAKAAGIGQLVYASSAGVYGTKDMYTENLLQHDSPLYRSVTTVFTSKPMKAQPGSTGEMTKLPALGCDPIRSMDPAATRE